MLVRIFQKLILASRRVYESDRTLVVKQFCHLFNLIGTDNSLSTKSKVYAENCQKIINVANTLIGLTYAKNYWKYPLVVIRQLLALRLAND